MRKLVLPALIAHTAAGCSVTPDTTSSGTIAAALPAQSCVYPDAPKQKAPAWICEESVPGITLQAMGMSEIRHGGVSHQRQLAMLDAQTVLAKQLTAAVDGLMNNYINTQSLDVDGFVTAESIQRNQSEIRRNLTGVRVYQSTVSEGGGYYVLAGLDKASSKQNLKQQLTAVIAANHQTLPLNSTNVASAQTGENARDQLIEKLTAYAQQ